MKKEDFIVSVKKEHIDSGVKLSCFDCPIAYAIIDAVSKDKHEKQRMYRRVSVANSINFPDISYSSMRLPDEIRRWVIDFDNGKKVKPFKFKVHFRSTHPVHAEIILI